MLDVYYSLVFIVDNFGVARLLIQADARLLEVSSTSILQVEMTLFLIENNTVLCIRLTTASIDYAITAPITSHRVADKHRRVIVAMRATPSHKYHH